MKKTLFAISAIAVLLGFTACTSENEILEPQVSGKTITIKASTEEATRTSLSGTDATGYNVVWSDGDQIKFGTTNDYVFTLKSGAGTTTGEFEGTAPAEGKYAVVYPANFNSTPTKQTYVKDNIPQGVPMMATGINVDADGNVAPISFKNVGGILRLNIKGTAKVTSIKISATGLDPITLDCGSTGVQLNESTATPFHIAVPGADGDGTAYSGLKIVITDDAGLVCTKTLKSDKSIAVKRSQITTVNLSATTFNPNYLCFTAQEDDATVKMAASASFTLPTLEYSTDLTTWNGFTIGTTTVTLANVGDKVYFRATEKLLSFSTTSLNYVHFNISKKVAASGNVMSLVDPTCQSTKIPCDGYFSRLFSGCSALTTAPELPATTLATGCYNSMFSGCSALETVPELPAEALAEGCYQNMFYECSALETAPELPAKTLAANCYNSMFNGCTSLTTAPELPATTLVEGCYQSMFKSCTKLTSVTCLATDISADGCVSVITGPSSFTTWLPSIRNVTCILYCAPGCTEMWKSTKGAIPKMGWNVEEKQ